MNAIFYPIFVWKLNYLPYHDHHNGSGYQSTRRHLWFSKNLNSFMLEKVKKKLSNKEKLIQLFTIASHFPGNLRDFAKLA